MHKHTIKDFLDGSVCVRCTSSEDKQRLLQLCTEDGITKPSFSTLSVQEIVALSNVFYVDRDEFALSMLPEATAKFCDVVPFSSLAHDTHQRRIVIDYSDTITTATLYNGDNAVKSTTINRCRRDNPSVHIAAIEVIDKLLAKQVKQPKPKKPAEKDGFNVGDRVVVNAPNLGNAHSAHGKHGTIVSLENEHYGENFFALELDELVYNHDCARQTKRGHGCYVNAGQLLHEQPVKLEVREVKRHAKAGEWVKIVNKRGWYNDRYKLGEILQVTTEQSPISVFLSCGGGAACDDEYVVLEGYQPEEPTNA